MAHPDHETRVGAHSVLSTVLVPSLLSLKRKHVESLPMSTSMEALNGGFSPKDENPEMNVQMEELNHVSDTAGEKYLPLAFHCESYCFKLILADGNMVWFSNNFLCFLVLILGFKENKKKYSYLSLIHVIC